MGTLELRDYNFGSIAVNGEVWRTDVVIDRLGRARKRLKKLSKKAEGHTPLSRGELKAYLREHAPEKIVVGTGMHGALRITGKAKQLLEKRGIGLITAKTPSAIISFTEMIDAGENAVAVLHLTC